MEDVVITDEDRYVMASLGVSEAQFVAARKEIERAQARKNPPSAADSDGLTREDHETAAALGVSREALAKARAREKAKS